MRLEELLHISISVVTITLAFSLYDLDKFIPVLIIVGSGFVLHELAHKYVAIHYGAKSEYRAWTIGLILAVGMSILTQGQFVFAAPGAVITVGNLTTRQSGKVSWAGPLTNLILAIAFFIIGLAIPEFRNFAFIGSYVNAFLGAFNMIPIFPLDGEKIAKWSQQVWLFTIIALVGMMLFVGTLRAI